MIEHATRYRENLGASDPIVRTVARRQLDRLRGHATPPLAPSTASRWRHVPLAELFRQHGNLLHRRPDGRFECSHEPIHSSRSGRCVLLDLQNGRWWCRSCRRSGDAATYVMAACGCGYRDAARWLSDRWGPPTHGSPRSGLSRLGRRVF